MDPDVLEPVLVAGPFDKRTLDPAYVRKRETLVTRGWRVCAELAGQEGVSIIDYPLPEVPAQNEQKAQ